MIITKTRIIALDSLYGKRNPDLEKIQQRQDKFTAGQVRAKALKEVRNAFDEMFVPCPERISREQLATLWNKIEAKIGTMPEREKGR